MADTYHEVTFWGEEDSLQKLNSYKWKLKAPLRLSISSANDFTVPPPGHAPTERFLDRKYWKVEDSGSLTLPPGFAMIKPGSDTLVQCTGGFRTNIIAGLKDVLDDGTLGQIRECKVPSGVKLEIIFTPSVPAAATITLGLGKDCSNLQSWAAYRTGIHGFGGQFIDGTAVVSSLRFPKNVSEHVCKELSKVLGKDTMFAMVLYCQTYMSASYSGDRLSREANARHLLTARLPNGSLGAELSLQELNEEYETKLKEWKNLKSSGSSNAYTMISY